LLHNFVVNICGCSQSWTPASFIDQYGKRAEGTASETIRLYLALSGGVDSTVAGVLLNKAIGKNLTCIFVDNGLLRKNEFEAYWNNTKAWG
jgi:GMP synthase (glutamine-hydrolysing)